jgi:hypothetical protein
MVHQWFALKTIETVFFGLSSKPVAMISPDLISKPMVIFLIEPQNESGGGFFGLCLKTAPLVW